MIVTSAMDRVPTRSPMVLVVDDESGVRRIATCVLQRFSIDTMEAADGDEALRIYQEKGSEIDLVLLDLSMPKLSGRETFAALKQMNEDVSVVLCSGYTIEIEAFAAETGCRPEGAIQKPFDIRSLGTTVRGLLGRFPLPDAASPV